MSRCIMMCAGEYTPIDVPLQPDDFLMGIDGGLAYLEKQNLFPDYILGDFDSLSPSYRSEVEKFACEHPENYRRLPVEKDDTDTMAAARVAVERGFQEVLIYSGLGNRLDHTLANIQTLKFLHEQGVQATLIGNGTRAAVLSDEEVDVRQKMGLSDSFDGLFSLFAMDEEVCDVTIQGMKYPADHALITNSFPIGCSNHMKAGVPARVRVGKGTALIITIKNQ